MRLNKLTSLTVHTDRVWQSQPHPTLPLLATASSDCSVQIISLHTFTPIHSLDSGHQRSIRSIAWQPNTPHPVLATGSFDATCGIWRYYPTTGDLGEYDYSTALDGHESEIKSVAWSAGGTFLATCARDKNVWVWEELEEDNFETLAVLQEHTQDIKCVAWHAEEVLLASASYDDTIRLYKEDVDDWECCAVLEGHEGTVWYVQFEPREDAKRLVSCSDDLSVRVWVRVEKFDGDKARPMSILRGDPVREDWVLESVLPKAHERSIYAVSWSPRSGRIVTCGGDGKIVVYEETPKTTWKIIAELGNAHGFFEINHVTWSRRFDKDGAGPEEEIIISCGDDGVVNVWVLEE
ncbi:WD40 repeat-like protein [Ascodesmis nigricans]|uniref:Probable cytosolic iron-sulfur protein assembly protein 1 n=1 Tax=Ascodesmis nigricans TaxID=341454 RepID=A0A4S2N677_9PEZI|nr:WD40 repeat-like protein [Ascodesmis nigricans]